MRQIIAIFPDITFTPCDAINAESFRSCVDGKLFLGYLGWSFWAAFRDRNLEELIASTSRLSNLKQFNAQGKGAAPLIRPSFWPFSEAAEEDAFLKWYPMFGSMRACFRSECGRNIKFGKRTHTEATDFWEKSLLFIWCVKRHKTAIPPSGSSEPVGVSRIYRLGQAGKLSQCPAARYPDGLAGVIEKIQPRPGSF
jgi:hypothetical protein